MLPRRRPTGLSLLEGLVTLGLVAVLMGVITALFQQYSRVTRHLQEGDALIATAYSALQTVASEAGGALQVLEPPPGVSAPSTRLVFQKLNPDARARLPASLAVLPEWFDPLEPSNLLQVSYEAQDGRSLRRVEAADPAVTARGIAVAPLAEGLTGFSVRWTDEHALELSTSFSRSGSVRRLSTQIRLRRS